jgi:hypothetical protein
MVGEQIPQFGLFITKMIADSLIMAIFFVISLRRNIRDYRETKRWNWARGLIILVWAMAFMSFFVRILHYGFQVPFPEGTMSPELLGASTNLTIPLIFGALTITFGLVAVFYINYWESLVYVPLFYFAFSLWVALTVDVPFFFNIYRLVGALIVILGFYATGYRLKDNNTLGFAILFSLYFVALLGPFWWQIMMDVPTLVFGVFYSLGKIKIFKEDY